MGMFRHVAAFEFRYQIRSPVFWGTSIIFAILAYATIASDDIRIAWGGQIFRNAPFSIAVNSMVWTIFAVFMATAFVSTVVLRDTETGFGPIIHATPLSKFNYLFGRFVGGFLATATAYLSVPLGLLLAVALPGVDPETVGPIHVGDYLLSFLFLCVPTLFIVSAAFFSLATMTRSLVATYVGALVVLAIYLFTSTYLSRPEFGAGATLADPFGIASVEYATRHWSAFERNTLFPPVGGLLLQNRVLWLGIALVLLALAWRSFARGSSGSAKKQKTAQTALARVEAAPQQRAAASVAPPSERSLGRGPLAALTRHELLGVVRSPTFLVILGFAFINSLVILWLAGDDRVATVYPVTRVMIEALLVSKTIPLFVAAFYAGELVWRDRECRINEIIDATPSPDWAFLLPKIAAISVVLLAMGVMNVTAAIAVQLLKGFTDIEVDHYLLWYLAPWVFTMILYAVLAVFVQTLVPHKFVGLLVILLVFLAEISLPSMGFESHLYLYATTSPVPLSDMNGLGEFAAHAAWYRAYWAAFAVILALLAYGLWRRGASAPLGARLRKLPARLKGPAGWGIAGAGTVMAGLGGFIFYNNYILNDFPTFNESQRWAADYEKTLLHYDDDPQPKITDITLEADIYPDVPKILSRGTMTIENKTTAPVTDVYVSWPRAQVQKSFIGTRVTPELQLKSLTVPSAKLAKEYPDFNFRVYRFDKPMAPGERRVIRFEALRDQRGFRNTGNEERIVGNGTFVENYTISPSLGISRWTLIEDRATRRKFGLTPDLAPLSETQGRKFNYIRHDSDPVNAEILLTGPADQTLLAPGEQISRKVNGARQSVRFRSEAPMMNFFSIQAARYAVRKDRWNDVAIEVYHHPAHRYNVDRMIDVSKDALDYYSSNFSPYQFRQFRIVEFPAYGKFAQAFPGTVPYSEAAGFILKIDDSTGVDFISYVTAHELAHQWWFHQVTGADTPGSTVLSETLAQYSTLMVMEKRYGPAMVQRFLKSAADGYLTTRGKDNVTEPTLEKVQEQAYVRYEKGGIVMYLLKDRMGEAAVNRALRSLIAKFALKGAPYATSSDLIAALRAEARPDQQQLITDLFQKITLYDLKADNARATRLPNGKWRIELTAEARKLYADKKGIESEAPIDELFDIGAFDVDPSTAAFRPVNVIKVEKWRLRSGRHRLAIVTDRRPSFVGLDPYLKYIDRNAQDNITPVLR